MSFSEDIKRIRTELMLSQTEFGQQINVGYPTILRWENGKSKPNLKAQRALASFCKENGIAFDILKSLEEDE